MNLGAKVESKRQKARLSPALSPDVMGKFPCAFGPPEAMKIGVVPAKAGTHCWSTLDSCLRGNTVIFWAAGTTGGGQRVRPPLHGATSSNNRRNKARMSMKTKDRGLECGSGTCGVSVLDRDGGRYRRRLRFQGGSCAVAFQNRRNKARMSMKTKDRGLECGSGTCEVSVLDRDGGRYHRRWRFQGGNCAVAFQNRRNKARMSMKTKDRLLECGS
jgi:diaminopimelate epimerase